MESAWSTVKYWKHASTIVWFSQCLNMIDDITVVFRSKEALYHCKQWCFAMGLTKFSWSCSQTLTAPAIFFLNVCQTPGARWIQAFKTFTFCFCKAMISQTYMHADVVFNCPSFGFHFKIFAMSSRLYHPVETSFKVLSFFVTIFFLNFRKRSCKAKMFDHLGHDYLLIWVSMVEHVH